MHTINLPIRDDIYDLLISKGIDINSELNEFVENLAFDEYPYISTKDAVQRVSKAVQKYENKTGVYTPYDTAFYEEMNQYIKSL
jgi:hypothetical protein